MDALPRQPVLRHRHRRPLDNRRHPRRNPPAVPPDGGCRRFVHGLIGRRRRRAILLRLRPRPRPGTREACRPPRPGAVASFANVTSNDRGITGILIDAFGLPPGAAPTAADVSLDVLSNGRWSPAPAPPSVTLQPAAGPGGSDRLALTLPDNSV